MMTNWKTTLGGVAAGVTALGAILTSVYQGHTPDMGQIQILIGLLSAAWVGITAKDSDK